jgi:hypothetical protein
MPHDLRDSSFESFRDHVLQALGLFVDLVPTISEGFDQKGLEESVMTEHLESDSPPGAGQPNAAVGGMLDQVELSEPPHHFGHGSRLDLETMGESLGAHSTVFSAEQEDLLEIVLLGFRQLGSPIIRHEYFRGLNHIFRLT